MASDALSIVTSAGELRAGEDDEDDRRTIRGVSTPVSPVDENGTKMKIGNGHLKEEKRASGDDQASTPVDAAFTQVR